MEDGGIVRVVKEIFPTCLVEMKFHGHMTTTHFPQATQAGIKEGGGREERVSKCEMGKIFSSE